MSTYVGLDLGAHSVKVAVLRTAYRKVTLDALVKVELAGAASREEAIRAAVHTALGRPGAGDGLATAISGASVAVRTLSVPAAAQRQLAEVLPFEIEASTPLEVEGAVFDFRVRGRPAADGEIGVMFALAREADVRAHIDGVKAALGAEPERVGAGILPAVALAAHMPALAEPGPVVLLDVGTTQSDVVVLEGGEPAFVRALPLGTQGLPGTASRLARELRVSLAAYRAQGGKAPEVVYLCGGGAFVSGAEGFLQGELEVPVRRLPAPGAGLELGPKVVPVASQLPLFAKAVGLALWLGSRQVPAFDLRRGPLAYERGYGWVREKVPVLAGFAAVIAVSFLFSAATQLYAAGKERDALEGALAQVTHEVLGKEVRGAAEAKELLASQSAAADEDPMPHADAFDVMVRLSEAIPQSVVHDIEELDVQKGHVVVHGIVGSVSDAQSIATSLRTDRCFQDVRITRTNQMVGSERQKYVMEFDVKCPEDQKGKKKDGAKPGASASSAPTGGGK
jgi:general secretion pathway protein L